jgi:hypothetical protein
MSMQDEIDRAGPVIDRLNAAIRENPLAAGLIGAGVAWMLFGGAKGFGAARGAAGKAGSAAVAAGSAVATGLTKAASAAASGLKDSASQIAGSVASIVPDLSVPDTGGLSDTAAGARSAIGDRLDSAAATGREYGAAIQSRLSESLERQPLLLGAIGLAIGAGIASTFATTAVESELMGEQGTAAREKLQNLADDVKGRATEVVADVKDEAARQGLTTAAAKSAAADIGEKIKTVAGAGRDSVTQRFSGS